MDKLIELVYYYNFEVKTFEVGIGLPNSDTDYYGLAIDKEKEIRKYKLMIISKEYGFIKWLVENNKIDIFKSGIDELPRMFGYDYESVECKSDRLVMMLSIQNDPIEFLVKILK